MFKKVLLSLCLFLPLLAPNLAAATSIPEITLDPPEPYQWAFESDSGYIVRPIRNAQSTKTPLLVTQVGYASGFTVPFVMFKEIYGMDSIQPAICINDEGAVYLDKTKFDVTISCNGYIKEEEGYAKQVTYTVVGEEENRDLIKEFSWVGEKNIHLGPNQYLMKMQGFIKPFAYMTLHGETSGMVENELMAWFHNNDSSSVYMGYFRTFGEKPSFKDLAVFALQKINKGVFIVARHTADYGLVKWYCDRGESEVIINGIELKAIVNCTIPEEKKVAITYSLALDGSNNLVTDVIMKFYSDVTIETPFGSLEYELPYPVLEYIFLSK